jgi:hypothetical protein
VADHDDWTGDHITEELPETRNDVVVLEIDEVAIARSTAPRPVRDPDLMPTFGKLVGPTGVSL